MIKKYREHYPYPFNQALFEDAKAEIIRKVPIPIYIMDNVDHTVNLFDNKKMCCPMHEENTPSFVYNEDRQLWTCYGSCSRSGKVIDLHMILNGIPNYYASLMHFKDMYGKKYNLQFKDFFMYDGNNSITVEETIALSERRAEKELDYSQFLSTQERSPQMLMVSIEQLLFNMKAMNQDLYIKYCIKFDALFSYKRTALEDLIKLETEMKGEIKNGNIN